MRIEFISYECIIRMYSYVHICTMYNAHCTMHTVQCTLYNAHCTMHTVHATLYRNLLL